MMAQSIVGYSGSASRVYGKRCLCAPGAAVVWNATHQQRALAPYVDLISLPLVASELSSPSCHWYSKHAVRTAFQKTQVHVEVQKSSETMSEQSLNVSLLLAGEGIKLSSSATAYRVWSEPLRGVGFHPLSSCYGLPTVSADSQVQTECAVDTAGTMSITDSGATLGAVVGVPIRVLEPVISIPFGASHVDIPLKLSSRKLRETNHERYTQDLLVHVELDSSSIHTVTVQVSVAAPAVASETTYFGGALGTSDLPPSPPLTDTIFGYYPCTCGHECLAAFDGVCDDGGPGSAFETCNLGSDCYDCGPIGMSERLT